MCDGVCITSNNRQIPARFAARMARLPIDAADGADFSADEALWSAALPMTLSAYVSGLSAFLHPRPSRSERRPEINLRALASGVGPVHARAATGAAATDGGTAVAAGPRCFRGPLPRGLQRPRQEVSDDLNMLGQLQDARGGRIAAQAAPAACLVSGRWCDLTTHTH